MGKMKSEPQIKITNKTGELLDLSSSYHRRSKGESSIIECVTAMTTDWTLNHFHLFTPQPILRYHHDEEETRFPPQHSSSQIPTVIPITDMMNLYKVWWDDTPFNGELRSPNEDKASPTSIDHESMSKYWLLLSGFLLRRIDWSGQKRPSPHSITSSCLIAKCTLEEVMVVVSGE